LGIDPSEVTFRKRGFPTAQPSVVAQLERVGAHFVRGYHEALAEPRLSRLGRALCGIDREYRGFAFEGAGMALALLDRLTPWSRQRLRSFLVGAGEAHVYMVTIGAGWAWARLGSRVEPQLARLDPILGWLALDGYGFHEGYFHTQRSVLAQEIPKGLRGTASRVFDAGLGRSLWFVCGADPDALAARIGCFAAGRRADLWAGSGLACSYAGGVGDAAVVRLCELAEPHRAALAQGAAFAAKARQQAGNPVEHTRRAVERICATSFELAAKLCDTELAEVSNRRGDAAGPPAFERWRSGIRGAFERSFASGWTLERLR
jgi:hypothetical protein